MTLVLCLRRRLFIDTAQLESWLGPGWKSSHEPFLGSGLVVMEEGGRLR